MKAKLPTGIELDGTVEEIAQFYQELKLPLSLPQTKRKITQNQITNQGDRKNYIEIKTANGELIRQENTRYLHIDGKMYNSIADFVETYHPNSPQDKKSLAARYFRQNIFIRIASRSNNSKELGEFMRKKIDEIINK